MGRPPKHEYNMSVCEMFYSQKMTTQQIADKVGKTYNCIWYVISRNSETYLKNLNAKKSSK